MRCHSNLVIFTGNLARAALQRPQPFRRRVRRDIALRRAQHLIPHHEFPHRRRPQQRRVEMQMQAPFVVRLPVGGAQRADLILVDGDPVADIRDIRKVARVVANGRMYDCGRLWESVGFRR
jgi:hypothetical protein